MLRWPFRSGERRTQEWHTPAYAQKIGNEYRYLVVVNRTHGMRLLRDSINEVAGRGASIIDKRTTIGRELTRWRGELIAALGGELSTQQTAVVDIAVRTKLLLDSVDAWLLAQPSLIDKRRRSVYPVLQQRQGLADSLVRYLTTLGLGRKAAKVPDLDAYIAAHDAASEIPSEQAKNHGDGDM